MESWPIGTTASASSYHAAWVTPSTGCPQGCFTTYYPSNAIDGNTTTFWNDDTLGVFPDTLSLNFPTSSPVSLTGIQILSDNDGYITAYDIYLSVSSSSAPFKAASVTGVTSSFSNPTNWNVPNPYTDSRGIISGITAVQINVNNAEGAPGNQYSRINEVYPLYGAAAVVSSSSSSSSSSSPSMVSTTMSSSSPSTATTASASATSSTSSGSSLRTSSVTGGIIGGLVGITALIATGLYFH